MSVLSTVHSATVVAGSDDSGGSSVLTIALLVLGVLLVLSFLGDPSPTVVVVQRPGFAFTAVLLVGAGLGLLYLLVHVPAGTF